MSKDLVKALAAYTESLHPIVYLHHFDFYELELALIQINPNALCIGFDAACGFTGVSGGSAANNSRNLSASVSSNTTANALSNTSAHRASSISNAVSLNHAASNIVSSNAVSFLQPPHYLHQFSSLSEFLAAVFNEGFRQPTFLVLKHVHHLLHEAAVISNLSRIAEYTIHHPDFSMTVFIESPVLYIPVELEHFITVFELPKPSVAEIYEMIREFAKVQQISVLPSVMTTLVWALKGLDACQIQQALSLAYHDGGGLDEKDKFIIQQEKLQLIKRSKLLENSNLLETVESNVDVCTSVNGDNDVLLHCNTGALNDNKVEAYSEFNIYSAAVGYGRAQGYNDRDNKSVWDSGIQGYNDRGNGVVGGYSSQGNNYGYNANNRTERAIRGVASLGGVNKLIGGLDKLKYCLYHKATVFKNLSSALDFGVELPRGVLITGLLGCGKTTMLETAARWFEVPVLKLNAAMLWEQSSGHVALKLQQALDLVEKVSPCVLLIDEIEQLLIVGNELSNHDSPFTNSALGFWDNCGGYTPQDSGRTFQDVGFNPLYGGRASQDAGFNPQGGRVSQDIGCNPQDGGIRA